jgi:hypothetical protein
MRSILLAAAVQGSTFTFGGAGSLPDPAHTVYGNAPIGHLQPRSGSVAPNSAAEQIEQEKMSRFNAEQRKLDEELDKRLNICRC